MSTRMMRAITVTALAVLSTAGVAPGASAPQNASPFRGKTALAIATSSSRVQIDRSVPTSTGRAYVRLQGSHNGGYVDQPFASTGRLTNGTWVYLVPLDSGGSAGVTSVLVFAWVSGASDLVGSVDSDGGHVGSKIVAGRVEIRMPIYGANDPNCCPSKLRTLHYTVAKGKLVVLDDRTARYPKSAFAPTKVFATAGDDKSAFAQSYADAAGISSLNAHAQTMLSPDLSSSKGAFAVQQTVGDVTVSGLDAVGANGRQDNAQSVGFTSPNQRVSAGVERVQTTAGSVQTVTQGAAVAYDDHAGIAVSGGVSTASGTNVAHAANATYANYGVTLYNPTTSVDARWNAIGSEFDPMDLDVSGAGTRGVSIDAHHRSGAISVSGSVNKYRDDSGTVATDDASLSMSAAVTKDVNVSLTTATNTIPTTDGTTPFRQSGISVSVKPTTDSAASVSYRAGQVGDGVVAESSVSTVVPLPFDGSLSLGHTRTAFTTLADQSLQLLDTAAVSKSFGADTTLSVGYRYVTGTLPTFLSPVRQKTGAFSFSFDHRVPVGILHVGYSDPNVFKSTPSVTVQLLHPSGD